MDRGHNGLCSGTNAVAAWKKLTGNSPPSAFANLRARISTSIPDDELTKALDMHTGHGGKAFGFLKHDGRAPPPSHSETKEAPPPSHSETKEAQDKVRRTVIGFAGVELTFDESDIVFSKIPRENDGSGTCV